MSAIRQRAWNLRGLFLAALLALAAPAAAQEAVEGEGILEAKHGAAMLLVVEEAQVKVGPETRILDGDGNRLSFSSIPAPGASTVNVQYQGTLVAGRVEASRLVVQVQPN